MTRRRLVYDHYIFSAHKFGGISRYFTEVARRVSRLDAWDVEVLALAYVNQYVPSLPPGIVHGWQVPAVPKTGRIRQAVNATLTRTLLSRNPPDLIHETYYDSPIESPRVPRVVTVHDMIHEIFPQYRAPGPNAKAAAVARAEQVICISESTRRDLLERFDVDPARVSVVYNASSLSAPPEGSDAPPGLESGAYLLYVGDRRAYKNFAGLLAGLAAAPSILRNHRLALYGGGALTAPERARISELRLPADSIVHVGSDDAMLPRLYRHAAMLVYPSLYEGFGIPLVEAMACLCPIACGPGSSLGEIAGDAAAYFDPSDPESIAATLTRLLESPAEADELRRRGRRREAEFSWDRCASETEAIYRKALG